MDREISFVLNGKPVSAPAGTGKTLLTYLREDLGLTGTKEGCGQGECGACTVLVDQQPVNSCMLFLDAVAGREVLTIEGLAQNGELDAVQKAFVDCGAIQCGFCTPGMIMTVKGLLIKTPKPTEEEIRTALSGNLCRCTGYRKIIDAVKVASGQMQPPSGAAAEGFSVVGRQAARRDTVQKALGQAKYADDIRIPGLLVARAKRSPYAHARIVGLDLAAAKGMPGVVAVLTADDIPGLPFCGQVYKDMPVICRDKVRNEGDPVAVVVAETDAAADAAVERIQVEYEPLPVIASIDDALAEGAVQIHDSGNIRQVFQVRKGDADAAFASCAAVVEDIFETQLSEHAFIETECSVAYIDPDDQVLTVCTPTQEVYSDRRQIAASLALPQNKVRVIQTVTGGAFGGKIDISTEIIAALAAYKTLRPVKYRYNRYESMATSTKRHPFRVQMRMGADAEGNLLAVQAKVLVDNGAYSSMGAKVVQKSCLNMCGPYRVDNVSIDSYLVYTNRPFGGAMRGFGIPQAAFAYESCLEMLAAKLGMDSWAIRRKNGTRPGDTTPGGKVLETANIDEHLEAAYTYWKNHPLARAEAADGRQKRGVGIASFIYPIGLGFGTNDTTTVIVRLCDDGSVLLVTGAADLGQGSDNVMARIAAEELGTTEDAIAVRSADSAYTPFAGLSSGSRQTYVTGRATLEAARQVKSSLLQAAGRLTGRDREAIQIKGGAVYVDGKRTEITFSQLASYCYANALPQVGMYTADITKSPVDMETGQGDPFSDFTYGAHVAEVTVDEESGEFTVDRIIAVHDVGKIINPISLEGQIDGALSMGYGQTVMEEVITENGKLLTPTFAEYMIPTSEDMPQVDFVALETPSHRGPYGARGIAEPPVVGVAPAICNAIYNAVGVRVTRLPVTAERLKALLDQKRDRGCENG